MKFILKVILIIFIYHVAEIMVKNFFNITGW